MLHTIQNTSTRTAALALVAATAGANAGLVYSFDTDAQGWSAVNDVSSFSWDGTIGNPGGAIQAVDQVAGDIWYFSAPAMDLGDFSGAYGETLSYDILGLRGSQTSVTAPADVMLTGGGLQIGIDVDVLPTTTEWTSWSISIDVSSDWRIVSSFSGGILTGSAATESQIQSVLADLDGLFIRGEYTNGSDSAAIDNVELVPAPGALSAILLMGAIGTRRRR